MLVEEVRLHSWFKDWLVQTARESSFHRWVLNTEKSLERCWVESDQFVLRKNIHYQELQFFTVEMTRLLNKRPSGWEGRSDGQNYSKVAFIVRFWEFFREIASSWYGGDAVAQSCWELVSIDDLPSMMRSLPNMQKGQDELSVICIAGIYRKISFYRKRNKIKSEVITSLKEHSGTPVECDVDTDVSILPSKSLSYRATKS